MANVINEIKSSFNRVCMKCMRWSVCRNDKDDINDNRFCNNDHGGIMAIENGPLSYIYGNTQQYRLPGKYSGVQCTSMALAAIIHQKAFPNLTPVGINAILAEGHKLHTRLRDDIKLSDNPDRRVAIEDFPSQNYLSLGKVFGKETCARLRQPCDYAFTSRIEGFEGFYTIAEYLKLWHLKRKRRRLGFIVTIGDFSHALLLNEDSSVLLFDSHGNLKNKGKFIKRVAGAVKCPSLTDLSKFLIDLYGEGRHSAIAMVCVHFLRQACPLRGGNKDGRKQQPGCSYKPYCLNADDKCARISIPEIQVDGVLVNDSVKECDDGTASPYIGLFGGGD